MDAPMDKRMTAKEYLEQAHRLDKLCRLNAAGASVHAGKAREAFIYRFRLHQRFDITRFDHVDKLMRVIFHFAV